MTETATAVAAAQNPATPKVIQIVGYKNSGKTTLTVRLISDLTARGYKIGAIKHDAHDFEMDTPGTDSWQLRQAGAHTTAITSPYRTAIITEQSTSLVDLIAAMTAMDIVLVEGFKHAAYPKILLLSSDNDATLLARLTNVIAVAVWQTGPVYPLPTYAVEDVAGLANLILTMSE